MDKYIDNCLFSAENPHGTQFDFSDEEEIAMYEKRGKKMSLSSAKEFIERMKTDDSLWLTHKAIKDKNKHRSLIRQAGYDFTDDELKTALDQFISDMLSSRRMKKYVQIG